MGKICYRQVFLEKNKIYCERKISKFIGTELELDHSSESDYLMILIKIILSEKMDFGVTFLCINQQ